VGIDRKKSRSSHGGRDDLQKRRKFRTAGRKKDRACSLRGFVGVPAANKLLGGNWSKFSIIKISNYSIIFPKRPSGLVAA